MAGRNPNDKPKGRKRIIELEVDENSLVDKPAIEETFYLIKSADGDQPMKTEHIQKAVSWKESVIKSADGQDNQKNCVFCNEEGGREPKIGLKCGVCFACAVDREEKGVFEQCLEGTFSLETYKEKYPDEFKEKSTTGKSASDHTEKALIPTNDMSREELKESLDERRKQFKIEVREDASLTFPSGFPEKLEDYGDPVNLKFPIESVERARNARVRFKQFAGRYDKESSKSIIHERIVRRELEFGIEPSFDAEDPLDRLLPSDLKNEIQKNLAKAEFESHIEKQFDELADMLRQSLDLHDNVAASLSQAVMLISTVMEQVMMLAQGEAEPSEEPSEELEQIAQLEDQVKGLKGKMTEEKNVTKVGAKISSGRLKLLQDISEKLSELIQSLTGGKKAGARNKATSLFTEEFKKLENSVKSMRIDASEKLDAIAKRIEDLENTAGASSGISEDEILKTEDRDTQKSIFSDLIGLDEIKVGIQRRENYLNQGGAKV